MRPFVRLWLVTLLGCAPATTDLEDPAHIASWANSTSAVAVFTIAQKPLAFADGELRFEDPLCPVIDASIGSVEIIGNCVDFRGRRWAGAAMVQRRGDGSRDIFLSGYGSALDSDPPEATGTVAIRPLEGGDRRFDIEVTQEGLFVWSISYSGRIRGGNIEPNTLSGSGTVSRDGLDGPTGVATATTVDETRDPEVCANQSASGSTTIELGGHTLALEYDGAADCDDERAARYRIDGEDRGLVPGVRH